MADEFSFEIEDVEFDEANPRTETVEIDSDEVDPDRVNVYNSEAGSDNADSNLMVQTESENEIKHAKSRLRHERNIKWSEKFFIDAKKLERPKDQVEKVTRVFHFRNLRRRIKLAFRGYRHLKWKSKLGLKKKVEIFRPPTIESANTSWML